MKTAVALLAIIASAFSLNGCSQASARPTAIPIPRQYIILLDLSMSRSEEVRNEGTEYLSKLSRSLNFGDHVTILQVQQTGLLDHPKRWTHVIYSPDDSSNVTSADNKRLAAEQESVRSAFKVLSQLQPGGKVLHTDLLTTLNLSGEYAHDFSPQRTTIIVLSDMLQSSNGIEMEHLKRMPRPGWIDSQKAMGLIPKLSGTCVVVVGADATTEQGAKIRGFWQSYFSAAGTNLSAANYRVTPPTDGTAVCRAD